MSFKKGSVHAARQEIEQRLASERKVRDSLRGISPIRGASPVRGSMRMSAPPPGSYVPTSANHAAHDPPSRNGLSAGGIFGKTAGSYRSNLPAPAALLSYTQAGVVSDIMHKLDDARLSAAEKAQVMSTVSTRLGIPDGRLHEAQAGTGFDAIGGAPHGAHLASDRLARAPRAAAPDATASDADAMPMRLAVEACVGADGARKPLREYICAHAPTALDGLGKLRGPELTSAVAEFAADFKRWRAEPVAEFAADFKRWRAEPRGRAARVPRAASAAHVRIEETALRGISLPQLRVFIADAARRCKAEKWKSTAPGRSEEVLTRETTTLYDLARYAIRPLAEETGLSVVETLADGPQPPDWFVSHWWGEDLLSFVKCLEQHCADRGLDEATTYYWVCAYALRQSALDEELEGGVGVSPFMRALQLTDGTISVLDSKAVAISRAWCALELYETLIGRGTAYLHDIYTAHAYTYTFVTLTDDYGGEPDRCDRFYSAVGLVDGFAVTDANSPRAMTKSQRESHFPRKTLDAAKTFGLKEADASRKEDLTAIMLLVGDREQLFDRTVRARFGMLTLTREADVAEHPTLLEDLRGSQLRKLTVECPSLSLCISLPDTLERLKLTRSQPRIVLQLCKQLEGGSLPHLRTLNLQGAEIRTVTGGWSEGPKAAVALAKALEGNSTLTTLILSGGLTRQGVGIPFGQNNAMDDKGCIALAKALEGNSTLTALDLRRAGAGRDVPPVSPSPPYAAHGESNNDLRHEAGIALAKVLEGNSTLTALDLSGNRLGDEAKAALRKAKERCGTLTSFRL